MSLGLVDDDEEISEITDRNYWETKKGTVKTVKIADDILNIITEISPGYELKYNKFYIGLAKDGHPDNFVTLRAKKSFLRMEIKLENSEKYEKEIEDHGLDLMDYDKRNGRYRIKLSSQDIKKNVDFIGRLIKYSKGLPVVEPPVIDKTITS